MVADTKPGNRWSFSASADRGTWQCSTPRQWGLNLVAEDVDDAKLDLAERLGASVIVNANTSDPIADLKKEIGCAYRALVTAVSGVIHVGRRMSAPLRRSSSHS